MTRLLEEGLAVFLVLLIQLVRDLLYSFPLLNNGQRLSQICQLALEAMM